MLQIEYKGDLSRDFIALGTSFTHFGPTAPSSRQKPCLLPATASSQLHSASSDSRNPHSDNNDSGNVNTSLIAVPGAPALIYDVATNITAGPGHACDRSKLEASDSSGSKINQCLTLLEKASKQPHPALFYNTKYYRDFPPSQSGASAHCDSPAKVETALQRVTCEERNATHGSGSAFRIGEGQDVGTRFESKLSHAATQFPLVGVSPVQFVSTKQIHQGGASDGLTHISTIPQPQQKDASLSDLDQAFVHHASETAMAKPSCKRSISSSELTDIQGVDKISPHVSELKACETLGKPPSKARSVSANPQGCNKMRLQPLTNLQQQSACSQTFRQERRKGRDVVAQAPTCVDHCKEAAASNLTNSLHTSQTSQPPPYQQSHQKILTPSLTSSIDCMSHHVAKHSLGRDSSCPMSAAQPKPVAQFLESCDSTTQLFNLEQLAVGKARARNGNDTEYKVAASKGTPGKGTAKDQSSERVAQDMASAPCNQASERVLPCELVTPVLVEDPARALKFKERHGLRIRVQTPYAQLGAQSSHVSLQASDASLKGTQRTTFVHAPNVVHGFTGPPSHPRDEPLTYGVTDKVADLLKEELLQLCNEFTAIGYEKALQVKALRSASSLASQVVDYVVDKPPTQGPQQPISPDLLRSAAELVRLCAVMKPDCMDPPSNSDVV